MASTVEHIQRPYSEAELLEFGREQARLVAEIADLEAQKKQAADHFKAEIGAREKQLTEFAAMTNQGYALETIPCDVLLNTPEPGIKSYVSQSTLAVVKVVPMTDADRQLGLYE